MKLRSTKLILGAVAGAVLFHALLASAAGQAAPQATTNPSPSPATAAKKSPSGRPAVAARKTSTASSAGAAEPRLMADHVYKNIQVLKGLTEDQFMDTMAFISGGLGTNCIHCHSLAIAAGKPERWLGFAADTPAKKTARQMMRMVQHDNATYFAGQQVITCYTCHHGSDDPPSSIPSIALQYGPPTQEEANYIPRQSDDSPKPDVLIDKYIAAVGGAARVGAMMSFVEKGTYSGYDTDFQPVPMEIDAKAPDKYSWSASTPFGVRSRIFNGKDGWNATPDTSQVVPVLPITGGRRFTYKVLAELEFPAEIKSSMTHWVTGKSQMIGGEPGNEDVAEREAYPVQGIDPADNLPIRLYFDKNTGLLARVYSYSKTPIGIIASETDYSDYRDVNGVKFPFHWVVSATDAQSVYDLTGVQINVPIDDAKFNQPAPPKLLTPAARPEGK